MMLDMGRRSEARHLLEQLLSMGELPIDVRVDTYRMLAEIELDAHRYRKTRRYLAAAISLDPNDPELYYRYAVAIDADAEANPRRAWKALKQAIRLEPGEASYWSAIGQCALRLKKHQSALKAFRKAISLESPRSDVLAEAVDGLTALGRHREAKKAVIKARFHSPHNLNIAKLWDHLQYEAAQRRQPVRERESILAFPNNNWDVVRKDQASSPRPHLMRWSGVRVEPRG
jgi:tetratricopeptide (TPR) repeat protein